MPDHWMTFATFNEQRYFTYPRPETYHGVVLNANMVAHAPAGVAAFLMGKVASRRYFIDPQTHAFQHEVSAILNNQGKVRQSIESLSKEYSTPIEDCLYQGIPIKPKHFEDSEERLGFVSRVIGFQQEFLSGWMSKAEENDYLQLSAEELRPYALLAPYFYLTESNFDRWFDVNVKLAVDALAEARKLNAKLFVPIVLAKGILDNLTLQEKIHRDLCLKEADGFVVWIDGFDESQESVLRLKNLLSFFGGIRKRPSQELINLHGGYYSILASGKLGKHSLTGVAHGPEFGEHRAVVPVGGGIPKAKFYIPGLHKRVPYAEAQAIFRRRGWLDSDDSYLKNICSCASCKRLIQEKGVAGFTDFGDSTVKLVSREGGFVRMEFPTTVAKQACLAHYLCRKESEFKQANKDEADLITDLLGAYCLFETSGEGLTEHLDRWSQALTGKGLSRE